MNRRRGFLADSEQLPAKIRLGFRVYGLWNQLLRMIGAYKTLA